MFQFVCLFVALCVFVRDRKRHKHRYMNSQRSVESPNQEISESLKKDNNVILTERTMSVAETYVYLDKSYCICEEIHSILLVC